MGRDEPLLRYLDAADVSGDVRRLFEPWEQRYGYVPPFRKVLAHNPAILKTWDRFYRRVRHEGEVDQYLKELSHVIIGQTLECPYCAASHGEILVTDYGQTLDLLAELDKGDFSSLDDTELAVARFALQLSQEPGDVSEAHIDDLRDNGFDDADIIELFVANCTSISSAALMKGLGVDPAHRDDALPGYYPSYAELD